MQDEWIRNLLIHRLELDPAKLQRTRELMDRALDTARITGYEVLIPTLQLPDQDDRHVLAAALHGGVELIVTQNLKDFPVEIMDPLGVQAISPDRFIGDLLATHPESVLEALRRGRSRYRAPTVSAEDLLAMLGRQGLAITAQALQASLDQF